MATGTLFVVATPIGNLDDITIRAVQVLRDVQLVACEDTRETQKILIYHHLTTPCIAYHQFTSPARVAQILSHLHNGEDVALVSDRGTPGISDPGTRLVHAAIHECIRVVPIPGPSACITALQASGVDTHTFLYLGYIPHKRSRQTFLRTALAHDATVVFYESPHRIMRCIEELIINGIGNRTLIVARELTKIHEEFLRGHAVDIQRILQERDTIRGEFVVILAPKNH